MKTIGWTQALVAGAAFVIIGSPVQAQEAVLKFATIDAPTAHLNVRINHPWAERINRQGAGVLKIDVRDGAALANQGNIYSRVIDDVFQIGWHVQIYSAGKFPLTDVVTLPFVADMSETASVAFWRLYKSGLLDAEYDDAMPLRLAVLPQSGVQYRVRPKSIESFEGLKVIGPAKITSQTVAALGGAPLSFRAQEWYEALQRGTADALVVGWSAFQPFKLHEVTNFHLDSSLGSNPGMIFMARKRYQALPEAARKIIDANATERETHEFGKMWDDTKREGREATEKLPGHTIVGLTPEQTAKWRERVSPVVDEWARSVPNGAKVLSAYRSLLAQVRAGS
jgi:TRAP-type C4-dicarboxylate transport system substrate-binding protein